MQHSIKTSSSAQTAWAASIITILMTLYCSTIFFQRAINPSYHCVLKEFCSSSLTSMYHHSDIYGFQIDNIREDALKFVQIITDYTKSNETIRLTFASFCVINPSSHILFEFDEQLIPISQTGKQISKALFNTAMHSSLIINDCSGRSRNLKCYFQLL